MLQNVRDVSFDVERHPLTSTDRGTIWHLLSHYTSGSKITIRMHLDASPAGMDDHMIASRLMDSFLAMVNHQNGMLPAGERAVSGIWEMVRHEFHGQIYRHAANRDVDGLADTLRNAMREPVTHGLGPGLEVFKATGDGAEGLRSNVLIILDRLASLAESLGVLSYENPEQGRYGQNLAFNADDLVARIEARLGYRIGRPPVMGVFGIAVGDQIIDTRVPDDAYAADRLKALMTLLRRSRVAEIGGGLGGCALQVARAGIAPYTIFDLPVVLLIQGWLLMKVCGAGAVSMFGEPDTGRALNLRPYWEFGDRDLPFDLVFNRDSLPEIPRPHAARYLRELADRGCALLSINQESQGPTDDPNVSQLWVHALAAEEQQLTCISRHPYWMRRGYIEEVFVPASEAERPATALPAWAAPAPPSPRSDGDAPLPPADLRERVSGTRDAAWFVQSGERTVREWLAALSSVDVTLKDCGTIVDFGCGCGRALRHLVPLLAPSQTLIGLDTDAAAIEWVGRNLGRVNALALGAMPPAPVADASADLVLSHSVFTHLPEAVHRAWLDELARIARPGAIVVLSFHGMKAEGEYKASLVDSGQADQLKDVATALETTGFHHVLGRASAEDSFPEYYGAAFHRIAYIARHWLEAFDLARWLPTHALDLQDVVVLRRKPVAGAVAAPAPVVTGPEEMQGGVQGTAPLDLESYFAAEARRPGPFEGQTSPRFQDMLARHHADIAAADCDFYHSITLPDGRTFKGEWDLRGHEATYLGRQDLSGRRVLEFGPASGWLSAYMARAGAQLMTLDLPFDGIPALMPFAGHDMRSQRAAMAGTVRRMRNSWWFLKRELGFEAMAAYLDIERLPPDLGHFDVAVFGCILLHLRNPFLVLQQAADITSDCIIVTDVVGGMHPGSPDQPGAVEFGPSGLPSGIVHWWALAPRAIGHMLHRLGFTEQETTFHSPPSGGPLFTVVARRRAGSEG